MTDSANSSGLMGRFFKRSRGEGDDTHGIAAQKRMMTAAEAFHRLRVDDVMVPRANIIAVETSTGLHDLTSAFKDAGHSRLPVFKESLDEPLGMVHIKDVLPYLMLDAKGRGGKTWEQWDSRVGDYLLSIQNADGSWVGHHCITSPVFVTAGAVLTLSADAEAVAEQTQPDTPKRDNAVTR